MSVMHRCSLLHKLEKHLGKERLRHSLGVEATAVELAVRYGADEKKAGIAGLMHDCAREMEHERARSLGERLGVFEDVWLLAESALWHAPLGAYIAREEYGITDIDVLSAVECHTTGRGRMSVLDKIIYLADYIEPGRNFESVDVLRAIARYDLDKALLTAFDTTIRYLLQSGKVIHPQTIWARNEAILNT